MDVKKKKKVCKVSLNMGMKMAGERHDFFLSVIVYLCDELWRALLSLI